MTTDQVDTKTLRRTFATFATGVTVVTVGGANPHGMTANSFTAVSLDPALVLVCVDRDAIMHASLVDTGTFGVSVLASGQEAVARHFANNHRPLGAAQFDFVECEPGEHCGAPLIVGAAAQYECAVWRCYEGGDHTIFVGSLLSMNRRVDEDVLVFLHGRFHQFDQVPRDLVS